MTCPPVGRHESAILRSPPTDPTGFIYPTYRAAPTQSSREKPSEKASHEGVAYLSYSVGGSVSMLSFEDSGSLRRITVFVRYENVVRLLEFFGYSLE
jgi:hypothetical protein